MSEERGPREVRRRNLDHSGASEEGAGEAREGGREARETRLSRIRVDVVSESILQARYTPRYRSSVEWVTRRQHTGNCGRVSFTSMTAHAATVPATWSPSPTSPPPPPGNTVDIRRETVPR